MLLSLLIFRYEMMDTWKSVLKPTFERHCSRKKYNWFRVEMMKIKEKLDDEMYDTPTAFLDDINELNATYSVSKHWKIADDLAENCISDFNSILQCAECYEVLNYFFFHKFLFS